MDVFRKQLRYRVLCIDDIEARGLQSCECLERIGYQTSFIKDFSGISKVLRCKTIDILILSGEKARDYYLRCENLLFNTYYHLPVILLLPIAEQANLAATLSRGEAQYLFLDDEGYYLEALPLLVDRAYHSHLRDHYLDGLANNLIDSIITIDSTGIILSFNATAESMFGLHAEYVLGQPMSHIFSPVIVNDLMLEIESYFHGARGDYIGKRNEILALRSDGSAFPVELALSHIQVGGEPQFMCLINDISSRKEVEADLRYHMRFEALLASISTRFVNIQKNDLQQTIEYVLGQIGKFVNVDRCYVFLFGVKDKNELNNFQWSASGIEDILDLSKFVRLKSFKWVSKQIFNNDIVHIRDINDIPVKAKMERQYFKQRGTKSCVLVPLNFDGQIEGYLGFESIRAGREWFDEDFPRLRLIAEIILRALHHQKDQQSIRETEAELRYANRKLQRLARIDSLTGIANRRYFDEVLSHEIRRALRLDAPISLIMGDLDYFKKYNDIYGHVVGDNCLREVANVINKIFKRAGDLPARYGGEEFVVILPASGAEEAQIAAERLRQAIWDLNILHEASKVANRVTISLGVVTLDADEHKESKQFIQAADKLLYQAKENGRNQVVSSNSITTQT